MQRKDREITDRGIIDEIIKQAQVCRMAMVDGDIPYIVPMCFGYQDNTLYFHSAKEGKKLDILKSNNNVCVEFDSNHELTSTYHPCKSTMKYRSVIGFGKAALVENPEEKQKALTVIFNQYSSEAPHFPRNSVDDTVVIKVDIDRISGKQSI